MRRFVIAAFTLTVSCAAQTATRSPARPWYGSWGVDLAGRDTTAPPGDDFFRYANGSWLVRTPIPPDRAFVGVFAVAIDSVEARLHAVLTEAATTSTLNPATLTQKLGAYYQSFMDSATVQRLGATPLEDALEDVRAAQTPAAVSALMGRNPRDFNGTLFSISIDVDLKDPSRYALYLGQGGLGLPDRDYYLMADFAAQRAAYQQYVEALLGLLAWPDASARARDVLAFETAIAEASWTKVQQRDPVATYNAMPLAELQRLAPAVDWTAFFKSAGIVDREQVIVLEKTAFPKLSAILARTPLPVLQAWQAFTIADNAAAFLSDPFVNARHQMRARTLSGVQVLPPRWKRAVRAIGGGDFVSGDRFQRFGSVGFGVGELYTDRYFPAAAKSKIFELVGNAESSVPQAYRDAGLDE